MDIKSTRYFRLKYMTDVRHCKEGDGHNIDFVGFEHQDDCGDYDKGFFELFHGDKKDIRNFIAQHLKNAEDGQAIYEFLQNAEDAGSSEFMVFYNDDYFLAVNNGEAFRQNGIRSILNVAQSDKKDGTKIGRFGIGFKLVHRLVGEGEGLDELLKDYCGPILFSWSREDDLRRMMNSESINAVDTIDDNTNLPYLFKILITNFPAGVGERVLDLNYEERVPFSYDEYREMSDIVKANLQTYLGRGILNQGTLFYIRLGSGKRERLDENFQTELRKGVEYSLNTLSNIQHVVINGNEIHKVELCLESGTIEKDTPTFSRINPEYKDSDIAFAVGYTIDFASEKPFEEAERLKASPTFYKFFPLGDEIHSSALFVHCDALSNQTNRRKLQDDKTNKELLPEIVNFISKRLSKYAEESDWEHFGKLYASILLTDKAHDNSAWLNSVFFDKLPLCLKSNIPVVNADETIGFVSTPQFVKIRGIECDVPLSLVNANYRWFVWSGEKYKELTSRSKEKIGLLKYSIMDYLKEVDSEKFGNWIKQATPKQYDAFLSELDNFLTKSTGEYKQYLKGKKLFKFSDGNFYSYDDLIVDVRSEKAEYINGRYIHPMIPKYRTQGYKVFVLSYMDGMEDILKALKIIYSEKNLGNYAGIRKVFLMPESKEVYAMISEAAKTNDLSLEQKKNLIRNLSSSEFKGVDTEKIRELYICYNNKGDKMPFTSLVGIKYNNTVVPSWMKPYQIRQEDYFEDLDQYMLKTTDFYSKVILKHWENIKVKEATLVKSFYSEVLSFYELDDSPTKTDLGNLAYVFTESGEYKSPENVYYNSELANSETIKYSDLHSALESVFNLSLPRHELLSFFESAPFSISGKRMTDLSPENESVSQNEVTALLETAKLTKEPFLNSFAISKEEEGYIISEISSDCPLAYTDKQDVKDFIADNCDDKFILFPSEFSDYLSLGSNILQKEDLYKAILHSVDDFESVQETLVGIIKYDDAKMEYLSELSGLTLDLDKDASDNAFPISVFKMAASVLKAEDRRKQFRRIVSFLKDGVSTPLADIQSSSSSTFSINGGKKEFDVSVILPKEYGNGILLKKAVEMLKSQGISESEINTLFGLSNTPDVEDIYASLKKGYKLLGNTQQLAFAILMTKDDATQFGFKAYDVDQQSQTTPFIVESHSFISRSYTLNKCYSDLGQYVSLPSVKDFFIQDCFIRDGKLISLNSISTQAGKDTQKVIDLLDYLMVLRNKNKELFSTVDWSTLKGDLGFTPASCAFPSKFAHDSEKLPLAVEKWAEEKDGAVALLADMGVLTEEMTEMRFRKKAIGLEVAYSETDIYGCSDTSKVSRIENSLKWLAGRNIFPLSKEGSKSLMNAIEQINKLREEVGRAKIIITDEFDFAALKASSTECSDKNYPDWSRETGIKIYLHPGPMPKKISIDEYITDTDIVDYAEGNIADTDDGGARIYVNSNSDLQAELHVLAKANSIGLTNEFVYKLFDESISVLQQQLESERKKNEELNRQLELRDFGKATMSAESPNEPGTNTQIDYNEEARKIVMERLQREGFSFTLGIGQYSNMQGVYDPEGKPVKIVVKSAYGGTVFINPREWADLLTPGSELWLVSSQGAYPIRLREMIRKQSKINLSIDTVNLDSDEGVTKIANLLRRLESIHFEFSSITPTHIAQDYHEYGFDDRKMDEKPSADEFPQ